MSDHELLQSYARDHTQPAFATLVERHVNLVYSAARRQLPSSHVAEDVTQAVFIELARTATKIPPSQPLAAWLYVVTRRMALNARRQEFRRLARETTAMEIAALKTPPESWPKVAALLDDAMETLSETERTAIVLRFFENQSLREVGESLGISEDTAQKRVSRAVDRLRLFFDHRGVAISGAAFAATLATNAVQAAPVGLAATISSSTAALPHAAVAVAKHLAMTTAQKTLATVAVAAAFGLALYEGIPALRLHAHVQEGQQRLDALAATARQLALAETNAARELARLNQDRSGATLTPERGTDAALAQEAAAWFARIARLKQTLEQHPELSIPELQLLTESDWLLAAINPNLSPEEIARSLRFLRLRAKQTFIERVSDASRRYFGTAKTWPTQFGQLAPFLTPPVDPAIPARYDLRVENGRFILAEKLAGAPDPDQLALCVLEDTHSKRGLSGFSGSETAEQRIVREADQAYTTANRGARATDPAQTLPFLARPLDAATLEKLFRRRPLAFRASAPTAAP